MPPKEVKEKRQRQRRGQLPPDTDKTTTAEARTVTVRYKETRQRQRRGQLPLDTNKTTTEARRVTAIYTYIMRREYSGEDVAMTDHAANLDTKNCPWR